ncbi:MAG: hypothetical protein LBH29_02285, partial [Elusimicrobiota bacterium]|nr:hypothetical protein [Elusimicrobiota bacterium]
MQNLLEDLKNLLEKRAEYIEDGKLFKNKIVEDALKLEPSLIKLLLKNKTIKETFFVEADGFLVFDKIAFQDFVLNEEFLPSSYTKFKKQLGLASGDKLFCKNREVSLIWAYKDCILEGGQTKEETKREEIFYNETLSPDEINVLFAPKVLTKFERISAETAESLLPSTQQSDSADRAGRLNKKEQNRQRLAARFCDTLISKISAANAASEIFEVCEKLKMQGDRAAFKETKSGSVAQPLDSKSLLPFTARKGFLKKS